MWLTRNFTQALTNFHITTFPPPLQAALAQQQAATQSMLIQQGQGHLAPHLAGQYAGQHSQVAAQVAAQLAVNPGYFANPNINAAAAAAAAAAVQNMMGEASFLLWSRELIGIRIILERLPSLKLTGHSCCQSNWMKTWVANGLGTVRGDVATPLSPSNAPLSPSNAPLFTPPPPPPLPSFKLLNGRMAYRRRPWERQWHVRLRPP